MKGSFISNVSPSSRRKERKLPEAYPKTFPKQDRNMNSNDSVELGARELEAVRACQAAHGTTFGQEVNRLVGLGLMFGGGVAPGPAESGSSVASGH
jgi:hypothetical protein